MAVWFRLLRPRGDRPLFTVLRAHLKSAPPPARRSTPLQPPPRPPHIGSSARAEIDPGSAPDDADSDRLLRPRGDRPSEVLVVPPQKSAPPPARRSTRVGAHGHGRRHGSSAR